MVFDPHAIFTDVVPFDPQRADDEWFASIPARWVVYLLAGENDEPIQLLSVKNLRASLKRRLTPAASDESPSRRVDYTRIVRKIYWRRVDSPLECDLVYLEAARQIFPETYRGMTGFRSAWFVHVDLDSNYPRYIKTTRPGQLPGQYLGPLEDKHAAARLIQLAEDAFDLCRYYSVLCESPHGKACAYKEMGRCPAPCDGSVSMQQYRRLMNWSVEVLLDPRHELHEQQERMRQAAEALKFEVAGRIKQHVDQLSQLGKGAFRHVKDLREFTYVALQHGPRAGTAKVLLILPGAVVHVASVISEPVGSDLFRLILELAEQYRSLSVDDAAAERISVVTHHLFSAKAKQGIFIHLHDTTVASLQRAVRDLQKQARPDTDSTDEGVLRELQQMDQSG